MPTMQSQANLGPYPLDLDAFADGIAALKLQVRRERCIHAGLADVVCGHLDAGLAAARAAMPAAARRRTLLVDEVDRIEPDNERGTGRTHRMIMSLPDDGQSVVVFAPTHELATLLREQILKLRGLHLARFVEVKGATESNVKRHHLPPARTFWDHSVSPHQVEMIKTRLAIWG